ncbi:MAG: hypothetical protein K2X87_08715 [Gemmataceae bacterium]|nr:hypothetical protein [Gemmataceae bacterium]
MRVLFALSLSLAPALARADEPTDPAVRIPREAVKKAVEAANWKDDGKGLRLTWKDDGVMTAGDLKVSYAATWAFQAPDKYRFDMTADGQKLTFVVNGDKAWEAAGGQAREVTGEKLDYARHQAYVFQVTSLAPLLRDDAFKLTALADKPVGDRAAAVVRVERAGRPAVTLYLDRGTGLLAKSETRVKDEFQDWKEVADVVYYEGWKDLGPYQAFSKFRVVRDGKPLIESKLSDLKVNPDLDPELFEKP